MCGSPLHLVEAFAFIDQVIQMRPLFRSLLLPSILALVACAGQPAPTSHPSVEMAYVVIAGVHDVVAQAHQVWSAQLNLRLAECQTKLPVGSATREQFTECLGVYAKNDEVVKVLDRLVAVQTAVRDTAITVADAQARTLEALDMAKQVLQLIQAAGSFSIRLNKIENLIKG